MTTNGTGTGTRNTSQNWPKLENEEINRYSRQLILPEIGVAGQCRLKASSVLVVGAGGLGCPAAIYLAAAGVGCLGLVDYDEVELSNLHRQVLHTEGRCGQLKAESAATSCSQLNSCVKCVVHNLSLDSSNALDIIKQYDVVLDCTDNVATRYLLNDACVILDKPLVSGSALRMEGQLTVYHSGAGPCYRCIFPEPPPPETVTNCSDGGVLGVVPGIIGSMQAMETIKLIVGFGEVLSGRLLLFDGLRCSFRRVSLRPRNPQCCVCGDTPSLTRLIDYTQFCGAAPHDKDEGLKVLDPKERISVQELANMRKSPHPPVVVDVRPPHELEICGLPDVFNVPLKQFQKAKKLEDLPEELVSHLSEVTSVKTDEKESPGGEPSDTNQPIVMLCRRGNDSQLAVRELRRLLGDENKLIVDVKGGLHAWSHSVDNSMPIY